MGSIHRHYNPFLKCIYVSTIPSYSYVNRTTPLAVMFKPSNSKLLSNSCIPWVVLYWKIHDMQDKALQRLRLIKEGFVLCCVWLQHECDYPKSITHLPILTAATNGHFTNSRDIHNRTCEALESGRGLYSIDADLLLSLKPTVIVTQDLCEVCSIDLVTVERIVHRSKMDPKPQIISLNPFSLQEVINDIVRVGQAVGVEDKAQAQVNQIQSELQSIKDQVAKLGEAKLKKCCFLEWTDPLFCGGHWTPAMIELVGGSHALNPPIPGKEHSGPSFVVTPEQVTELDPDVIIICPCGLDLKMGRIEASQMAKAPWW